MDLRALLRTALALSGVSRRARASQSSTERGMTSTARERRIRASTADDSKFTVSFQSRTEFGMCSSAVMKMSAKAHILQSRGTLTFTQHAFLGFDIVLKVRRGEPDLDALSNVLHRVRENDFGVVIILQTRRESEERHEMLKILT